MRAILFPIFWRGGGLSGRDGDIDHVGQLEEDLDDLLSWICDLRVRGARSWPEGCPSDAACEPRVVVRPRRSLWSPVSPPTKSLMRRARSHGVAAFWGSASLHPRLLNLLRLRRSCFALLSQAILKLRPSRFLLRDLFPDIQPSNHSVDRPIQG
jgi:hypothetical protein